MKRISFTVVIAGVTLIGITGNIEAAPRRANPDAKLHRYSTTIEKERPQLNDETKRLIAAYRRDPSEANYAVLKKQVERNYDAVVARKKAKLEELKRTARDQYKVEEMQNIIDEMLRDRDQRVENSMRRFTDQRFRPGLRNRSAGGYQQVLGAGLIRTRIISKTEYGCLKNSGRDRSRPPGPHSMPSIFSIMSVEKQAVVLVNIISDIGFARFFAFYLHKSLQFQRAPSFLVK